MSLLNLKVHFQAEDGKLLEREIKCAPLTSSLAFKIEACALFGLPDHIKYGIFYKRQLVPSLAALKDSSIVPGSTLMLARKNGKPIRKSIALSVRFMQNGQPSKAFGAFESGSLFLDALQSLKEGDKNFNALRHQTGMLPLLSVANTQLDWKLLMQLIGYTFHDLDISGNQLFALQFVTAADDEFIAFTSAIESNYKAPDFITERGAHVSHNPTSSAATNQNTSASQASQGSLSSNDVLQIRPALNIQFTATRHVPSSASAPDLPDSFYDLTVDECKSFLGGYRNTVKEIVDRPLVSAKWQQHKNDSPAKESVTIKFVFPDHVHVTATVPSSLKASELYNFLKNDIICGDIRLQLLTGPPMKLIHADDSTLFQLGISTSTRIIVDCPLESIKYKVQL